jgi:hypothetical protein
MEPWQRRLLLEPYFETKIPFEDEVNIFNDAAGYFFGNQLLRYIIERGGYTACCDLFDDDVNVRSIFLDIDAWLTEDPRLWVSIDMFVCRFKEAFNSLSDHIKHNIRFNLRKGPYLAFPSRIIEILND